MGSDEKTEAIDVCCPVCSARLTVDAETGGVLEVDHKSAKSRDFDALLGGVMSEGRQREDKFKRAFKAEKKRTDTLGKKFERASKRAARDKDRDGSSSSD
ncbi:MAG: hypothetical protein OEQ13_12220 [Acidobacteriota bacterium]|nr:hypothetical protein [Acidobacteriota bacterium]